MQKHGNALASAPTSPANSADGGKRRLFYTLKEAADLLAISPETYYRGVREGRLPGRKVGGQWRVSCGVLHRYAEEGGPAGDPRAEPASAPAGGDAA